MGGGGSVAGEAKVAFNKSIYIPAVNIISPAIKISNGQGG
jgi:hypothetical protein